MDKRVNIPVRVIRPGESRALWVENPEPATRSRPPYFERGVLPDTKSEESAPTPSAIDRGPGSAPSGGRPLAPNEAAPRRDAQSKAEREGPAPQVERESEEESWRDRALRLQAEMDNFRKRQQRRADEQIDEERVRILGAFLPIVDDLERALAASGGDDQGLRQGVELIRRSALKLLQQEGVEPIEAKGQRFDPNWHEAVATVQRGGRDIAPYTITHVVEPGYRLGDRLLRPARVVVVVE